MKTATTRQLLILLTGALLALLPSALAQTRVSTSQEDQQVLHVLNRLTFGPRPGDLEAVKSMGIATFIKGQLYPDTLRDPAELTRYVNGLPALALTPAQLYLQYGPPAAKSQIGGGRKLSADERKDMQMLLRDNYREIYEQEAAARLKRAIESPRQLEEVMTDFWYNHFNISKDKGFDHLWVGAFEQQAIRPYALGRFRDLLGSTCHHAAMLFYLDNWQNTDPQSRGSRGKFSGLNENYARELMELHTLGVDGGYTQQDVIALARILTGLGLPSARGGLFSPFAPNNNTGYYFAQARHDFTDKQFLGRTIRGSGEQEVEQALDMLCRHPSTAHHVCYQLAQYFVADKPPEELVTRLSNRFLQTDGDIREVLNELFSSSEFMDPRYFNNKYKTPYHYVISCVRAANVPVNNFRPLYGFLKQQGMPLYSCLTPDGYKNTQQAWLNPDGMLRRVSFATALASGHFPQNRTQPLDYGSLEKTMGSQFSSNTLSAIEKAPQTLRSCLVLGSPEFMYF